MHGRGVQRVQFSSQGGRPGASPACSRPRRRHATAIFTGLVQGTATVDRVGERQGFRTLQLKFPPSTLEGIRLGASVAVNGTCLTVTSSAGDTAAFDVIEETLRVTNLGGLQEGSRVNFERSARVGDEIGGHTVSGHIHTTATLVDRQDTPDNCRLTFQGYEPAQVSPQWVKYILPKGFVAVDGTSLTVGEVEADRFCVYLIPETLRVTTLGSRGEGDRVNIEVEQQTQVTVDTIERILPRYLPPDILATAQGGPPLSL